MASAHQRRAVSGRGGAWNEDEVEALFEGIRVHGEGNWTTILTDMRFNAVLRRRTSCDLKDKWRSCCRRARVAQEKGEAPVPLPICVTKALFSSAHVVGSGAAYSASVKDKRRSRSKNNTNTGNAVAGTAGSNGKRLGRAPQRKLSSGHGGAWSSSEVEALVAGVLVYGEGAWRTILDDMRFARVLRNRTNADLKDKWRVVCKRSKSSSSSSRIASRETTPPLVASASENHLVDPFFENTDSFHASVEDGTLLDMSLPLGNEGAACSLVTRIDPPTSPSLPRAANGTDSAITSALSVEMTQGTDAVNPVVGGGHDTPGDAFVGSDSVGSDLWMWDYESAANLPSPLEQEASIYDLGFGRTGSTNVLTTKG